MKLEFQLTKEDLKEYQKFCRQISKIIGKSSKKSFWLTLTVAGGMFIAASFLLRAANIDGVSFIIGVVLMALAFVLISKFYAKMFQQINPDIYSPQQISFGKSGINAKSSITEFKASWDWFLGAMETPNLFVLIVDYGRGVLIPKRCFKDEKEIENFKNLCALNNTHLDIFHRV